MEKSSDNAPRPAPGQTIYVERRERAGCLRRMLWGLLIVSVFLNIGLFSSQSGLGPHKLNEVYVAGKNAIIGPKIAIVEVDGIIIDESVEHVLKQIRQAREDDQVKAIVLRVDSPGGTVSGSDRIWRELSTPLDPKAKKPIVVSMGGMAASGGYYVSAPADYIFAEPTTMTGSIGVIMQVPELHGLLEKVGVKFTVIKTGDWKDSSSIFKPMTDAENQRWREMIDDAFGRFVRVIGQGRKLSESNVRALANGKVYTANEALKLKLIDAIGYRDDAIMKAQKLANVEDIRVIRYARPLGILDVLANVKAEKPGIRLDSETALRLQVPQVLFLAQ